MGNICQLLYFGTLYSFYKWVRFFTSNDLQYVHAFVHFYTALLLAATFQVWPEKGGIGEMKNKIRIERAILNITQAELADQLQVSRQTINAIEAGKYSPSLALGLKLAKIFNQKVEDIFELEEGD